MPHPGARILQLVKFVRPGVKVADIGTDHAYLPIYLIKSGVSIFVVAADINEGPLERARRNVSKAGVQQQVEVRRSDGLRAILPQEADDIVIAGMGGELILSIIRACSWLQDARKRLILSPNSRAPVLRKGLYEYGFCILQERAVREAGKVYTVMHVQYDGSMDYNPVEVYTGKLYINPTDQEYAYLYKEIGRLGKMVAQFLIF